MTLVTGREAPGGHRGLCGIDTQTWCTLKSREVRTHKQFRCLELRTAASVHVLEPSLIRKYEYKQGGIR